MCPDTTDTAPNSPIARALHRMTPYKRPQRTLGRVMRSRICRPLAPSVSAASSSSLPWACMVAMSSRATSGKVTNVVAMTMPGTAKMILMSCSDSHGPNQPWAPNNKTKIKPEITGETLNGRSTTVISTLLPQKSYLEISQAAATPNTTLSGTEMPAVSNVSLMASRVSSCARAAQYGPTPLENAEANTVAIGATRNMAKNSSATPINSTRTSTLSPT